MNFVKFCQNPKKIPCFSCFLFKSTNFAQILKKIAQKCVLTSSAFRSSCHGLAFKPVKEARRSSSWQHLPPPRNFFKTGESDQIHNNTKLLKNQDEEKNVQKKEHWVNLSKRGGMNKVFQVVARLLPGISQGEAEGSSRGAQMSSTGSIKPYCLYRFVSLTVSK